MSTRTTISPDTRINETIRLYPATVSVFQRHAMDSCCGGARTLAEVAERHQVDLDALLEELNQAAAG